MRTWRSNIFDFLTINRKQILTGQLLFVACVVMVSTVEGCFVLYVTITLN